LNIFEIIMLSVGLAMDAFSVSVCKGLSMKRIDRKGAFVTALFFGFFQAGMPVIGYLLGSRFMDKIESIDHWIAFVLLVFIGGKMIFEAITEKDDEEAGEYRLNYWELTVLAVATSIDALAVGLVFAASGTSIIFPVTMIGTITFALSLAGVFIGHRFGGKFGNKAEIAGGVILILIGTKLLLEGVGLL